MNWDTNFAKRTKYIKRSPIREILKLTAQPDVISFAGGLPAPEVFPMERINGVFGKVLSSYKSDALQYSTTEGFLPLRKFLAKRYSNKNITIDPDNILIVTGAQQGLDLTARLFLNEKDKVVIENPTYLGLLLACNTYNPTYLAVASDDEGMRTDKLGKLFSQGVKFVYLVPNFQNPQGTTISKKRRIELVKLAKKYSVTIIEDNPYGELRYSGKEIPSLMELDAVNLGAKGINGHVIYMGTFSKTLAPGLRVGWIIAPKPVINKFVEIKQSTDLHTGSLDQLLVYEAANNGFLDKHIKEIIKVYGNRRDVMLSAIQKHFPKEVKWTRPEGGLFLMAYMPESYDATELLKEALKHKVAFVPGIDFHVDGMGRNTFRLNFSNASPQMIEEGISRLGLILKKYLASGKTQSKMMEQMS